jgi:hypothetical protein
MLEEQERLVGLGELEIIVEREERDGREGREEQDG